MAYNILVPQVGQDLTEATIIELHVKLGDRVTKGDLVAVVESEKASFEVEAFASGVVISLPYAAGDVATVLTPLMILGEAGEAAATAAVQIAGPAASPAATVAPDATLLVAAVPVAAPISGGLRASPAARRLAAERGLDVAGIAGSGPDGAVVLRDVGTAQVAPALSAGGIALRTLQSGTGTPIVFIHGFGADLSSWRPLVGQIGLGLPMLALDLPGHGASQSHSATDFAAIVAAVGQTLSGLQGPMHLVGHSLGSAVAAALTARGDLDIRSLTLISPAGLGATINGQFVDGFLAARTETALTAWMRNLVSPTATLASVLVRATMAARDVAGLVPAQTRVAKAVFEGSTQLFSVTTALRAYQGPSAVILGRDDTILAVKEVEAAVPQQTALYRLDRVGHLPHVEAVTLVTTLITRTIRAAG